MAYTTFGGSSGVFVRGTAGGAPELASVSSDGVPGNGSSFTGSGPLSADGRFIAFFSGASNLAPGDTNELFDVYVRDRRAGTTELVSAAFTPAGAAPSTPQTPVTPAPAAAFAKLVLEALRPVVLHSHKPSLHVNVKASKATTITLTLRDRNGHRLASWHRHAEAGKNTYSLLLPPKARKPGHETLQVAAAGSPAARTLGVTLKA
jgi:hypothetical protein